MPDRPEEYPDFAMDDVASPISGENNVAEPPAGVKALGWDYRSKPPRQYMNWVHRTTALWVRWLTEQLDTIREVLVDSTPDPEPDTLMARDEAGRAQVVDPVEPQDIATKNYVDMETGANTVRTFTNARWDGRELEIAGLTLGHRAAIAVQNPRFGAVYDTDTETLRAVNFLPASGWLVEGTPLTISVGAPSVNVRLVSFTANPTNVAQRVAFSTGATVQAYGFNGTAWSAVGSAGNFALAAMRLAALTPERIAICDGGSDGSLRTVEFNGTSWSQIGTVLDLELTDGYDSLEVVPLSANTVAVAVALGMVARLRAYEFDGTNWTPITHWGLPNLGIVSQTMRLAALSDREVAVTLDSAGGVEARRITTARLENGAWVNAGVALWTDGTFGSCLAISAINGTRLAGVWLSGSNGGRILDLEYSTMPPPHRPT